MKGNFIFIFVFFAFGCTPKVEKLVEEYKQELMKETVVEETNKALDLSNMDLTVDPGDDFYKFANGGWMEKTTIPDDKGRWGSFDELREYNDSVTLNVLNDALNSGKYMEGTDEYKAGVIFDNYLDVESRNKLGIQPIQGQIDAISAISDLKDVIDYVTKNTNIGLGSFIGFGASPDMMNSNVNVGYLYPGGLGLSRDYYLDEDKEEIRQKYVLHISKMLQFVGKNNEESLAIAKNILKLETQLAEVRLSKEEARNPTATYHPHTIEEAFALLPIWDLKNYFSVRKVPAQDKIIVTQPKYFEFLNDFLKNTKVEALKELLLWGLIDVNADILSTEIDKVNFDFFGIVLKGIEKQRALEKRALEAVNGSLGFAVGKLYVNKVFPPKAKERASKMVQNILDTYKIRIKDLEWMTDSTKVAAIDKVNNFTVKIGYPDEWKSYATLDVVSKEKGGGLYSNITSIRAWNITDNLQKIGKEVDKKEWFMPPQTVNAYYHPLHNEIVFPAAILQPPFFNFEADDALNYGGIGAVIGHEISHGFDDQGARFDKNGNMQNWWTEKDNEAFGKLGKKLVAYFDKLEALPGLYVNGSFTLGENIGDLGGINVGLHALKDELKRTGKTEKIDGFTPVQRYFISWATIWSTKFRDEALKNRIATDPHSPGQFRAVGPIVQMDEFYEAFDVDESNKLFVKPENRIKIW